MNGGGGTSKEGREESDAQQLDRAMKAEQEAGVGLALNNEGSPAASSSSAGCVEQIQRQPKKRLREPPPPPPPPSGGSATSPSWVPSSPPKRRRSSGAGGDDDSCQQCRRIWALLSIHKRRCQRGDNCAQKGDATMNIIQSRFGRRRCGTASVNSCAHAKNGDDEKKGDGAKGDDMTIGAVTLKQQQQRLLLLRHACNCPCAVGECRVTPHCAVLKQLWKHIADCKDQRCQVPHCLSSRYVLSHYHRCVNMDCQVCGPVREAMGNARQAAAEAKQKEAKQKEEAAARIRSIDLHLLLLHHSWGCAAAAPAAECPSENCRKMKMLLDHPKTCALSAAAAADNLLEVTMRSLAIDESEENLEATFQSSLEIR